MLVACIFQMLTRVCSLTVVSVDCAVTARGRGSKYVRTGSVSVYVVLCPIIHNTKIDTVLEVGFLLLP